MSQTDCQLLGAYFDGELTEEDMRGFRDHLKACESCRQELESLQKAAELMAQVQFEDLSESELAQLHETVDSAADNSILRIAGAMALMAASVLIVCCAWIGELPSADSATQAVAAPQPWEQVATTLRPGPLQLNNDIDVIQLADARVADWMLQSLSVKVSQP